MFFKGKSGVPSREQPLNRKKKLNIRSRVLKVYFSNIIISENNIDYKCLSYLINNTFMFSNSGEFSNCTLNQIKEVIIQMI